jgi:hypothetical protein
VHNGKSGASFWKSIAKVDSFYINFLNRQNDSKKGDLMYSFNVKVKLIQMRFWEKQRADFYP